MNLLRVPLHSWGVPLDSRGASLHSRGASLHPLGASLHSRGLASIRRRRALRPSGSADVRSACRLAVASLQFDATLLLGATVLLATAVLGSPRSLSAQVPEAQEVPAPRHEGTAPDRDPPSIEGPPAPRAPAVISRDDEGNATVRAIRLAAPLEVDGDLREPVYGESLPIGGFIQSLPDEGAPATEETEVWITYDRDHVYVSARVHEEVPESEWVANEMRRDSNGIGNNENFGVVFDTYYDRRNGFFFYTNPLGALADVQLTNEGSPNFDWNPVWEVGTGRFSGGWTLEMAIPFKSLRYRPGAAQVWGVQLRRGIQRKNEWSHLTLVSSSAAGTGRSGATRISRAATLVGLEVPEGGLDLDLKPYGIGEMRTDRASTPPISNESRADFGADLKWGVTQNLTADFTYNTDFAQVEVDEQQVNLTRFSLFFPEKREFFLESRGIFDFPSAGAGGGRGRGGSTPTLFFSRRIGLQDGAPVPILAGGRLTGKVGAFDVGAVGIQTDDAAGVEADATRFTVLRLRRDVLRRSSVGALFTGRSRSPAGEGSSETYGADASFAFHEDVYLSGYYARTRTPGVETGDASYEARFGYDGDEGGFQMGHLVVEDRFDPEVGFVRRTGFRESRLSARLSPRTRSLDRVRQITLEGSLDYLDDHRRGYVETREAGARLQVELENSDRLTVRYTDTYELLEEEFAIHEGVTLPVGRYSFAATELGYSFGTQRWFSGDLSVRRGEFFDGRLTSAGFSRGRIEVLRKLSVEPSLSWNRVELPHGDFETVLAVTRLNFTFTPRMFLSGLAQYNSSNESFSSNLRLRWEYAPGSELFLVYTEERNTDVFDRLSRLSNRGLVVKVNRLFRF